MATLRRRAARVLLLDEADRVLLFAAMDPSRPTRPAYWFPVGGGVEEGETLEQAAIREVEEETGLILAAIGAPVLTRRARFEFDETLYDQDETYFSATVAAFTPSTTGWTELEQSSIVDRRWWSTTELRETSEVVFPEGLADLLERLINRGRPR